MGLALENLNGRVSRRVNIARSSIILIPALRGRISREVNSLIADALERVRIEVYSHLVTLIRRRHFRHLSCRGLEQEHKLLVAYLGIDSYKRRRG